MLSTPNTKLHQSMSKTIGYDASNQPEYDDAVAVEAAIPYCSDGWHKKKYGGSIPYCTSCAWYYVYKSYKVVNGWFSLYAVNAVFSLLTINGLFALLGVNSAFSILSVNSALSICSINSFMAVGCINDAFKICV